MSRGQQFTPVLTAVSSEFGSVVLSDNVGKA